jgi:hypothetical protein
MNVVAIAHSAIKRINDPMQPVPYDQFGIKLDQRAASLFKESVDAILFATYDVIVKADDTGRKGKAYGEGKRVLYTSCMPGHEGKNRFGLPHELDLDYGVFAAHLGKEDTEKAGVLYEKLKTQVPTIKDEKTRVKAQKTLEDSKGSLPELMKIDQRVQQVIGGV